jgi:hypothetical protein
MDTFQIRRVVMLDTRKIPALTPMLCQCRCGRVGVYVVSGVRVCVHVS